MLKSAVALFGCPVVILAFVLAGCGHSTDQGGFPCHAEEGLYRVTFQKKDAQPPRTVETCSNDKVDEIAGAYEVDFDGGELSCSADSLSTGRVVKQVSIEGRGMCDVYVIFEGNPTEDGIEPGPAIARVECEDQDVLCEYTFDSSYEKSEEAQ